MVTSGRLIVHAPVQGDSGSGGYLEAIFRFAARELFGVHIPPEQQLPYKAQRNSDHQEVELIVPSFPLTSLTMATVFLRHCTRTGVDYKILTLF